SEEHTSELQSLTNLVCRLLLEKKKKTLPSVRSSVLMVLARCRNAVCCTCSSGVPILLSCGTNESADDVFLLISPHPSPAHRLLLSIPSWSPQVFLAPRLASSLHYRVLVTTLDASC